MKPYAKIILGSEIVIASVLYGMPLLNGPNSRVINHKIGDGCDSLISRAYLGRRDTVINYTSLNNSDLDSLTVMLEKAVHYEDLHKQLDLIVH
ncbi:MAG: hypothetical protein ACP5OA_05615 [Candidatus Woesearchaeota archaeon]